MAVEIYHKAGDRVILASTGEQGIVVCTWADEHGDLECYVCFFKDGWPQPGVKPEKPYVLRYYATSLIPQKESSA